LGQAQKYGNSWPHNPDFRNGAFFKDFNNNANIALWQLVGLVFCPLLQIVDDASNEAYGGWTPILRRMAAVGF